MPDILVAVLSLSVVEWRSDAMEDRLLSRPVFQLLSRQIVRDTGGDMPDCHMARLRLLMHRRFAGRYSVMVGAVAPVPDMQTCNACPG